MTHPFDKAREAALQAMSVVYGGDGIYRAMLNAALSALAAHGYVLVPVEPTEAMMEAIDAVNDAERARLQKSAHSVSQKSWRDTHIASHKAMLAAWKKEAGK